MRRNWRRVSLAGAKAGFVDAVSTHGVELGAHPGQIPKAVLPLNPDLQD